VEGAREEVPQEGLWRPRPAGPGHSQRQETSARCGCAVRRGLLGFLGRPRIERTFAQELARTIPLPVDAQMTAAARGLQIAGIYVCLVGNQNLADCACLRDVFKVEGKERIAQLMQGAVGDWRELPTRLSGGSSGR